jgi:hypothetical protein
MVNKVEAAMMAPQSARRHQRQQDPPEDPHRSGAVDELPEPELQPAIASAVAAQNATSAAGVFLSPTAGSFRVNSG